MVGHKFAIILGGSSGVGLALVPKLHDANILVAVIGRSVKKIEKLNGFNNKLTELYECDAKDEASLKQTFDAIFCKHDRVDHLINTIGSSESKSFLDNSTEGFSNDIDANLKAPYLSIYFSHKFMPQGGSIVNVSSIRARTGTPSGVGYAAAKAGLINLTKSAAMQLASKKIRVNCIVPSAIYPTGMSSRWSEQKLQKIASEVPFGRVSSPEEIAEIIYFFISDASQLITGQVLDINGGEFIL